MSLQRVDTPVVGRWLSRPGPFGRIPSRGLVCSVILFDALDYRSLRSLLSIQRSLDVSTRTLPWIAAAYVVTYG
jgi:hypothetical protein